jgi:hypothetical protein
MTVLGDYELLEKLGQGSTGVVFKARHRRLNRIVAVKVLVPAATRDADGLKRWRREVQEARQLVHPNIVRVYGAEEAGGHHFLVMEFVEGVKMASLLSQRGALPVDYAMSFVLQLARGLEFAHASGVVQSDVSPTNLLVSRDGQVKIQHVGITPPSVQGELSVDDCLEAGAAKPQRPDPRNDIYALGCTLYALLTGEVPTSAGASLRARRGDVPEELEQICRKMLSAAPEQRYQSAGEVVKNLAPLTGAAVAATNETPYQADGQLLNHLLQNASVSAELLATQGPAVRRSASCPAAAAGTAPQYYMPAQQPQNSQKKLIWLISGMAGAAVVLIIGVWVLFGRRPPQPQQQQVVAAETDVAKTPAKAIEKTPDPDPPAKTLPPVKTEPVPKVEPPKTEEPKTEPPPKVEPPKKEPVKWKRPPPSDDPDRRVAEWFVGICGYARAVSPDGKRLLFEKPKSIPASRFFITFLSLDKVPEDPEKLAELQDLQRLDYLLVNCRVPDEFLLDLQEMGSLRVMMFGRGVLQDAAVERVGGIRGLTELRFFDNEELTAEGYKHLAALANLEKFEVSNQDSLNDACLEFVASLPKLKTLEVRTCPNITNDALRAIGKASSIEIVRLDTHAISDDGLKHLAGLTALQILALKNTSVAGPGLVHLVGLGKLSHLDLASTPLTDDGLQHVPKMARLSELDLANCDRITDEGLRHLAKHPRLLTLSLENCSGVTDRGLQHLHGLRSLVSLTVKGTKVTPRAIVALKKVNRRVEINPN